MKRKLNPNLVQFRTEHSTDEHWVFLREPKTDGNCREVGIGPVEIDEIPENASSRAALQKQLAQTEIALSSLAGVQPEKSPRIVLSKDCFDLTGRVRVLIYSERAFA